MKTPTTYGFVKRFKEKEFAENLLYKGQLHCKTLKYFKDLEEKETGNRADKNEGIFLIQHIKDLEEFTIDGTSVPISNLTSPIKIHQNQYDKCNIYCMTTISTDGTERNIEDIYNKIKLPLDKDNKGLGDYVVFIHEPVDFLHKVFNKSSELKLKAKNKKIKYLDLNESTYIEPDEVAFVKDKSDYGHQNEYRLMFSGKGETVNIEIGSLEKIAYLLTVKEFNDLLKVEVLDV